MQPLSSNSIHADETFIDNENHRGHLNEIRSTFAENERHMAQSDYDDEEEDSSITLPPLNYSIKILFALNGAIEVVPSLVLTSLINDRVQMPLEYIPSYYAIEFLPYSLKPLYAILTYWLSTTTTRKIAMEIHNRDRANGADEIYDDDGLNNNRTRPKFQIQRYTLIVILQVFASISVGATAFLPSKSLTPCFMLGFLRGFTISWAEFLNGLALISSAKAISEERECHSNQQQQQINYYNLSKQNYEEKLLSSHQSQAAMSRNVGSLIGQILIFCVIVGRNRSFESETKDRSLGDTFVTLTLLGSAFIPLTAAIVSYRGRVGSYATRTQTRVTRSNIIDNNNDDQLRHRITRHTAYDRVGNDDEYASTSTSTSTRISPTIHMKSNNKSRNIHITRVGIYLILRHSVPSTSGLTGSFLYAVFRSRPLYLQFKSLLMSITSVASTWFYGHFISKIYSNIQDISRIIVITTILTSLGSLMFIPFYNEFRESSDRRSTESIQDDQDDDGSDSILDFQGSNIILVLFTIFQLMESFFAEVAFLPSIILGTNTIAHGGDTSSHFSITTLNENHNEANGDEDDHDVCHGNSHITQDSEQNTFDSQSVLGPCSLLQRWLLDYGILYGIMITCIDFGDQLGNWFAGPLVKGFGIERANKWENLNWYILLCSFLSIVSLVFLRILWHSSKPVDR